MSIWVYKQTEFSPQLWTVGWEDQSGTWYPDSDHSKKEDAADRCAFMNGGKSGAYEQIQRFREVPQTEDEEERERREIELLKKERVARIAELAAKRHQEREARKRESVPEPGQGYQPTATVRAVAIMATILYASARDISVREAVAKADEIIEFILNEED